MFKNSSKDYFVAVILDPCHMLKLAKNAAASLKTFYDKMVTKFNGHSFTSYTFYDRFLRLRPVGRWFPTTTSSTYYDPVHRPFLTQAL